MFLEVFMYFRDYETGTAAKVQKNLQKNLLSVEHDKNFNIKQMARFTLNYRLNMQFCLLAVPQ